MNRRDFIRTGAAAGGGLLVAFHLPARAAAPEPEVVVHKLNAFLEIDSDGAVTIAAPVPEIGQGVRTAVPQIVADELDVGWRDVRVRQAPANADYGRMAAAGSNSIATYWDPLRHAGAMARALLIAAAAQKWEVDAAECRTEDGVVHHDATGRRLPYGQLADVSARLEPPEDVPLKDEADFKLIGKPLPRVDLKDIVRGRASYGLDQRPPNLAFAAVARPPFQNGRVVRFDADAARKMPGVIDVIEVEPAVIRNQLYGAVRGGVAVLADTTWNALRARDALDVTWEENPSADESTQALRARFEEGAGRPPELVLRDEGRPAGVDRWLEATYELPLLAHVCMEPMNFTAYVRDGQCDLVGPTQDPRTLQTVVAIGLEMDAENVHVQPTLSGGGFGRRLAYDYGVEAAFIARRSDRPVQVVWSREDDVQHDYYRPPSYHRLRAGLDVNNQVVAWQHHVLTPSLRRHILGPDADNPALYDVQGAADVPFDLPHVRVAYTSVPIGVQCGSWRSVSHSSNTFVVNSFLDEIAREANVDPLELHHALIGERRMAETVLPFPGRRGRVPCDTGRLRRVLDSVSRTAAWRGSAAAEGRGRGLAHCFYKGTYAAVVAEVRADGPTPTVEKVTVAIDCGRVVNPSGVAAQVEGAVMDGVATVLHWGITIEKGRVQQSNFHDFPATRMTEAPEVEVHIVADDRAPEGAGEPPYPPIAPAICNAIFAATGRRIRRLPLGADPAYQDSTGLTAKT